MVDTSMPGGNGIALQQPLQWAYDFDPANKLLRGAFGGELNMPGAVNLSGSVNLSGTLSPALSIANGGTGDTGTAWTAYTPTCTATSGTITAYTASGRYKLIGKTCFWAANVQITTLGTASVALRISLPVTSNPAMDALGTAFDISLGSALLLARIPGGNIPLMIVSTTGGAFPVAAGGSLDVSCVYETA